MIAASRHGTISTEHPASRTVSNIRMTRLAVGWVNQMNRLVSKTHLNRTAEIASRCRSADHTAGAVSRPCDGHRRLTDIWDMPAIFIRQGSGDGATINPSREIQLPAFSRPKLRNLEMAIKVMDEREILRPELATKSRPAGTPRSTRRVRCVALSDRSTSGVKVDDHIQRAPTSVDAIETLATLCSLRDSRRMKKGSWTYSGTGLGLCLGLGVAVIASAAIFVGAPLLHSSFGFDRSLHPSSVVSHSTFAVKTLPAQVVAAGHSSAASPVVKHPETTSRPLQMSTSTMGCAQASAVKSATVIIGNHTTENIPGSQPTNVSKAVGQTLGETSTTKSKSSGFDVNNPPGALFSHVTDR